MRFLAIAVVISLALYTALAMAGHPTFLATQLASAGPIGIYPVDVVLGLAVLALLAISAFSLRPDPVLINRLTVWLCIAYLGYQLFVVLPAAVLLHDLRPIDVLRDQEARLGLILVLVIYSFVLRYCRPALVVTLFDIAAAALTLWVVYLFMGNGEQGVMEGGRYTVRAIWGGATLLIGWLFFTSLFYWPVRWWRVVLAVLALGGVVLANHRSGFVALLAALTVQMMATGRLTRRVVLTVAVIAFLGVGVYYGAPSVRASAAYSLRTMFNSNADANAQDRVERTRLAFDYFVEHPLGDYIWNQRYYLVNVSGPNRTFPPHNFVVQLLVIQGVVPSLLFFAVIGCTAFIAWRNRDNPLSAVMLAYLTFYLVFCLFNTTIDQYENMALFPVAVALILHQNRALREAAGTASAQVGAADVSLSSSTARLR